MILRERIREKTIKVLGNDLPWLEEDLGELADKIISKILEEFEKVLPKEQNIIEELCDCGIEFVGDVYIDKNNSIVCSNCEKPQKQKSWNTCLAKIRAKLKEMREDGR